MNEESITPLGTSGLRALPEKFKRAIGRLFGRRAGDHAHGPPEPRVSPEIRERAAASIREYAEDNETLFNRASRFEERVERLQEGDGTTSESAIRRAERARAEILAGLAGLREGFGSSEGREGTLAFDAALETAYPQLVGGEER